MRRGAKTGFRSSAGTRHARDFGLDVWSVSADAGKFRNRFQHDVANDRRALRLFFPVITSLWIRSPRYHFDGAAEPKTHKFLGKRFYSLLLATPASANVAMP
jgi:predicted RecB family nuclease